MTTDDSEFAGQVDHRFILSGKRSGGPRAWISNLTVDPDHRQRGIARALLSAGIAHLRSRGARSVTLGVDADNPAPFRLYQSVGFEIDSGMQAWDREL